MLPTIHKRTILLTKAEHVLNGLDIDCQHTAGELADMVFESEAETDKDFLIELYGFLVNNGSISLADFLRGVE